MERDYVISGEGNTAVIIVIIIVGVNKSCVGWIITSNLDSVDNVVLVSAAVRFLGRRPF